MVWQLLSILTLCFTSLSWGLIPEVHTQEELSKLYLKSPGDVSKVTAQAISDFYQGLKSFTKVEADQRTPENTLKAWDRLSWNLINYFEYFLGLSMVEPKEDLREAYSNAYQKLHGIYVKTLADLPEIYTSLKQLESRMMHGHLLLNAEDRYYLKDLLSNFELEGMHLSSEKREKLKAIKLEMISLQEAFEKNIRKDTSHIFACENQLKGVPSQVVDNLKKNGKNQFVLACDYPTYFAVMRQCENEDIRQSLYRAFSNRAYPENISILHQLLAKRDNMAKLLGFPSYAHMELSTQMAKSPETVQNFLAKLKKSSGHYQKDELEKYLQSVGSEFRLNESGKLNPWDISYIQEKYLKKTLQLDQEKIREYFPFDSTVNGLISVYERFFNLKIDREKTNGLWSEEVITLKITDNKSKKLLGYLMLDLFPRANKYSHACHVTIVPGIEKQDQSYIPTVSLVIANFSKPTSNKPSLLSHMQAKTFFHEFGHAIHAMLGKTKYFGTSGTNTKVDFVELPSQILEEWLWDKDILKMVSSHYQTKKSLPDDMIESLLTSRSLSSASFIAQQCFLSRLSLDYHLEGELKDTTKLYENIRNEMDLIASHDPKTHYQASFGHLREYASRYYGYLWSRVFAADLFEKIKRKGLLNSEIGTLYRKKVLSHGGGKDPSEMLRDFLGRDPNQRAFFQIMQIGQN